MSACRSCGAPVVWAETVATAKRAGRKLPLDADPADRARALRVDDGLVVFERDGAGRVLSTGDGTPLVRVLPKSARPAKGGMRAHFSTCPNASQHRRPA